MLLNSYGCNFNKEVLPLNKMGRSSFSGENIEVKNQLLQSSLARVWMLVEDDLDFDQCLVKVATV